MTAMNGMSQPNEGFIQPSPHEMRTSPDAPPISAETRAKNQRQYERNMAQVVLAGKVFNTGDPDVDLELWTQKPTSGEPSLAEVFSDKWEGWRSARTKAVDGVALEAFLQESGLIEKAEELRDKLKKAA